TLPQALTAAAECAVEVMHMVQLDAQPGTFELHGELPTMARAVESCLPEPDDVALVLHTSGTTSRPKLVGITHRSLVLSAHSVAETMYLGPDDTCLSVMPMFHAHGFVAGLFASFAAGATVCCAPGFNAIAFKSWLATSRATWYTAVPAMHQAILARIRSSSLDPPQHALRLI